MAASDNRDAEVLKLCKSNFITIIIIVSGSRSISIIIIITTFCTSVDTWKMVWKGYFALPLFTRRLLTWAEVFALWLSTHTDSIQTEWGLPDRRQMEKYLPANIPNFNKAMHSTAAERKRGPPPPPKITGSDANKSMWPPLRRHLTR